MKFIIQSFKAASSRFGLSVLVFLTLFHVFLTQKKVGNIESQLESFAVKSSERIHEGLVQKDLGTIQDSLRLVLGKDAKWLAFSSPELNQITLSPLLIGSVELENHFQLKRSFNIDYEGAIVGRIDYYIDVWSLTLSLLRQNALLYLFVVLFMISVITYINEGIMRKLAQMDHDLSAISEAAKQSQVSVTDEFFQKEIDKLEANRSNYSNGLLRVFRSLQSVITTEQKIKSLEATSTLARQVAHDIRSPLSALDIVLATTQNMPEDKRHLARSAITRIKDIANDLLNQAPKPDASSSNSMKTSAHLISSLIESILSEKRAQYRNLINAHIDFELTQNVYGLFADVDPVEFKRIISNLINNSVEALPDDKGRVIVLLTSNKNQITCEIRDSGRGIPARLLSHLGKKGFSFGKEGTSAGSGLGLYHARTTIESWGGKLDVESTEGKGTSLFLSLKRVAAPNWFCQSLTIPKGARVVVLDDDSSIHRVWQSRLEQPLFLKEIEILHFSMPEAFENWLKQKSGPQDIYLIDEEFVGSSRNGLDIIAQSEIATKSILVTNRHEETALLKQAEEAGLRILPKIMAPMIPIDLPDTQTGGAMKDKPADETTSSATSHQNSV